MKNSRVGRKSNIVIVRSTENLQQEALNVYVHIIDYVLCNAKQFTTLSSRLTEINDVKRYLYQVLMFPLSEPDVNISNGNQIKLEWMDLFRNSCKNICVISGCTRDNSFLLDWLPCLFE